MVLVKNYQVRKGKGILFIDSSDQAISKEYKLYDLVGIKRASFFEWLPGKTQESKRSAKILLNLDPHQSKLIYIAQDGSGRVRDWKLNE